MLIALLSMIDINLDVDAAFDIDNAVGAQLDVLGVILGLNRTLTFQPTDGSSPILNDENYRSLLKAKIVLNHWNGSMETLTDALNTWNPDINFAVKDNQDMSFNVAVLGASTLQKEIIEHGYVVPKPAGVSIIYSFSSSVIFAYDNKTGTLDGYDAGTWV
jgi:hypothetical protein